MKSKSSGEGVEDTPVDISAGTMNSHTEYEEYLDLSREFTGERLRKLVRKVE